MVHNGLRIHVECDNIYKIKEKNRRNKMKIVSVKIQNFRGYNDSVKIDFDKLTVFVGKNDVGKSTVLEALDIFFNDGKGTIKIEKNDVNVSQAQEGNFETIISVCFDKLPDNIIIDSNVKTTLQDEYMLNDEGYLEVIKKYKNGGTAKVFIKAKHPTNSKCSNLLLLKNADLKKIVNDEDINCENQTINTNLRRAIWNNYKENLQLKDIEIDVSKEDAKKIWDKLEGYMPVYSLFQSDRKNSDGDNEVQDPLKEAVKQILADSKLQNKLFEIAEEVNKTLKEVSDRTLEKIREMDPNIANSLTPVIPSSSNLKWQDVFKSVSITGDDNIPINKRGSGVKRLVLLNFFRAEAERISEELDEKTGIIYAIEEPETSQHTENQRSLIEAFKKMVLNDKTQVILTTHSSNIVKQLEFSNLSLITSTEKNEKNISSVSPGQLNYPSLNEVNYVAFGEVSEEYHDELYAYIEFQGWKNEYILGKQTRLYKRIKPDGTAIDEQKILTEYIRHQIHHPENKLNIRYSTEELKTSIDLMRAFIQIKHSNGISAEP